MPKRGERVAPPPAPGEWEIRYATSEAARGWEELCRNAPNSAAECWKALRKSPREAINPKRQFRLKGTLGTRVLRGQDLEQWQYEVTGGGRVFYCPDAHSGIVWLTHAGTGHPKATE